MACMNCNSILVALTSKPVSKGKGTPSKSRTSLWVGLSVVAVFAGVIILALPENNGRPGNGRTLIDSAQRLEKEGDYQGAIKVYQAMVENYPRFVEAQYNLAILLRVSGDYAGSLNHNQMALNAQPVFPEAYINLGITYENLHDRVKARECYYKALEQRPNFYEAYNSLAIMDSDEGNVDSAVKWYKECLRVRDSDAVRIKMALKLPPAYKSSEDMKERWDKVLADLKKINARPSLKVNQDAHFDVGSVPFYLAYTGFDNKEHMRMTYKVNAKIDPALKFVAPYLIPYKQGQVIPPGVVPLSESGKIRVGIISRHLRNHSIGKFMRGIFKSLPRDRVELISIFPGQGADGVSEYIAKHSDRMVQVPEKLFVARDTISKLQLHFLLYADIGMESFTYFLAFSRLAPVQAVTHGHPCTTGIPTLDYFVSFKDYEPPENQKFYTEKLVLLDGQSSPYLTPEPPIVLKTREQYNFSLTSMDHVYMIPQSIFKFHPMYDDVLLRLIRADPLAKIAVIKESHAGWAQIVLDRLRSRGATEDMIAKFVFLPRVEWAEFLNFLSIADVVLDPHPFGGDTSSRESLFMTTPVVTLPSEQLAGRYSQAFLKRVGLEELIAKDFDDYISIATRVASDKDYQASLRKKLTKTRSNLFHQKDVANAWEEFFVESVQKVIPSIKFES